MLVRHGLEVALTQDVGLLKATDLRQLEYAIANRAVIVTHDKDFLDFHKQGRTHAGIVLTPPHPIYYTEIVRICLRMAGEVAEKCGTAKRDS